MQFHVTPLLNKHSLKNYRYIFEMAETEDVTLQSVFPHANAFRHMPRENVIQTSWI